MNEVIWKSQHDDSYITFYDQYMELSNVDLITTDTVMLICLYAVLPYIRSISSISLCWYSPLALGTTTSTTSTGVIVTASFSSKSYTIKVMMMITTTAAINDAVLVLVVVTLMMTILIITVAVFNCRDSKFCWQQ